MAEPQIGARIVVKGQDDVRASFARMAQDADASISRVGRSVSTVGSAGTRVVQAATGVGKAAVGIASAAIGTLGGLVNTVTGAVGIAISSVNTMAGAFGAAGAVATVGVSGLLYAAKSYAQSVAEGVSESKDLADSVGLSVEELTRLQAVVRLAGGDGTKFGEALKQMNRRVLDLAAGNEQAEESFEQLGLSIEDFRDKKGNLIGTRAQLDILIDRLGKVRNPALQTKAAMDVLGKSGKELGGLFAEGSRGLRDAEEEVARYGTTVKDQVAEDFNDLLGQQLELQESLRGLGLSFARIFFPFFSASAQRVSTWLNENRTRIEEFLQSTLTFVESVRDDIVELFTGGSDFNFTLFDSIRGPVDFLRRAALDLWDALMGRGFGTRAPEIKAFADVLVAAGEAALALGERLLAAFGVSFDTLPTAQEALAGLRLALDAFKEGLAGLEGQGDMAWANNLGAAAGSVADAIGTLGRIVNDNKVPITEFAKDALKGLSEGLLAIEAMVNGQPIDGTNRFKFLEDWKLKVENAVTFIKKWFDILTGDFSRASGTLLAIGTTVFDFLDKVGRMLGLGDGTEGSAGREAAIVLAVLALSGALTILAPLASIVASITAAFASLVGVLVTVGGWFGSLVGLTAAATGGMAVAWAAFWAGLLYVAYESIKWIFQNWEDIKAGWKAVTDLLGALGRAAWDVITSTFGGMAEFFKNPIDKIANMFSTLWGGIKNGASGAWNAVKRLFGGRTPPELEGGDGGVSEPSFDVGGIVPGSPGQPRRAIVHGGERILTVGETSLFDQLLNGFSAMSGFEPQTAFAAAPLAMPSRGGGSGLIGGGIDILPGDRQFYANQQTWKAFKAAVQRNGLGVRTQRARS